jgi:hypothetical protein
VSTKLISTVLIIYLEKESNVKKNETVYTDISVLTKTKNREYKNVDIKCSM